MVAQDGTDPRRYHAADRLLVRSGRQGGPWLVALAVAALASAAGALALPAVLGGAVDALVRDGSPGPWLMWCVLLVGLLVAADMLDSLAAGAAIARSTAWLRHELWRHVLATHRATAGRFPPGDVAGRLVGNAAEAGRVAPDVLRAGANLIPAVGGTVALALIDPWLCATFLIGMPIFVLAVRAFARDASDVAARYFGVQGEITGRLVDAMSGARTIAASGTLDREVGRVLAPLPELRRHGLAIWRTQMRITTQDVLIVSLLEIAVLAVAGAQLARGRITPGQMLAASQYVVLATALGSAITAMVRLTRSRAAAARVAEILAEPPVRYGTARLPAGRGRLEFCGVTVRAGGRPILEGLDLVVPAGALVAVVGQTGAGKSLLAALVGRLVDPDEGQVLLDGVPLARLDRDELRRTVGYGFERPVLIGDALADVIGFGAYTPPPAEVVAAACAAQADGFIRRLPEGYRTRLVDAPMSGGEAQRVGLARTFAHAGRVVVLDDVAASLDTVTEHHISRVLATALADRTRIVVAHRASTAARADLVAWLAGGAVRAVEPHHRLWHDAEYRALFEPDGQAPGLRAAGNGESTWWSPPAETPSRPAGTWCSWSTDVTGGVA
jgi:ATP-binding cassette subfamily B protein